jgi:formylmethanofuran dehydrogenase subunit E
VMFGRSFEELLGECEKLHGHICPGQVLGVRMALLGCGLIGVRDPRGADRKRLIVWVEIDRCMTDAVSAVTGVRLGRRSLKFLDYGKVAATFLDLESGAAARVVAREDARALAEERFPRLQSKRERQMAAYREARDEELFKVEQVSVKLNEEDLPGRPRSRVLCENCAEGVNDGREVRSRDGETLCRPCADGAFYRPIEGAGHS